MLVIFVKVKPGASHNELHVESPNMLSVKIKAKPVDGQANRYLVDYLAEKLNISRSKITIQKGASSRMKRIALGIVQSEWDEILKKISV